MAKDNMCRARMKVGKRAATLAALIYLLPAFQTGAAEVEDVAAAFQPHLSVYDLSLDPASSSDDISAVDGRMVIDWRGGQACGGYTVNQRLVTRVIDQSGATGTKDLRLSTWEALDGSRYRFNFTLYEDGIITDTLSGTAAKEGDKVVVSYDDPDGERLELPANVLFPMALTLAVERAARMGKHIMSAPVFDGTDNRNIYDLTAVIGLSRPATADAADARISGDESGAQIKTLEAWPVALSYFVRGVNVDGKPDFQESYRLFPNGIMSSIKLDDGDFALLGKLREVKYHKRDAC